MEISIKKEDLQTKSLFVATPMYGGMNHGLYMKACLDLQSLCIQYGVAIKFSFLFNESLITRARNSLVDEFIHRSECSHMLFIDSDIHFNPKDVIALLALDKDVAGSSIEVNRIYPVVVVIETVYVTLDRGIEVGSLFIHLHLCMQGYLPQWIIAQELANLEGFGIQHTLE